MANTNFIVRHGLVVANGAANVATINTAGITANAFTGNGINLTTINATNITTGTLPSARLSGTYSGMTANNSSFLGGTAAASYQLNSTLAANVATLTANNASFLGGVAAASYQLNSTLAANVAASTTFGQNTVTANTFGTTIDVNSTTGNVALRVIQRNSGDAFRVDDIGGDVTPFIIDTAGRMIHGHESNLFVGANWSRQYHGNLGATAGSNHLGWGAAPSLVFTYSTNETVANGVSPTLPTTQSIFTHLTRLFVHTNTDVYTEASRISFVSDQEANGTAAPTALQIFSQNGTSTTLAARYSFASNGNFGIGQTSPTERLHVIGNGLFTGNVTANIFSGNGTSITSLNANNITTGTINDARLPTTVVRSVNVVYTSEGTVVTGISASITDGILTISVSRSGSESPP